jgi:hypothetical protein
MWRGPLVALHETLRVWSHYGLAVEASKQHRSARRVQLWTGGAVSVCFVTAVSFPK